MNILKLATATLAAALVSMPVLVFADSNGRDRGAKRLAKIDLDGNGSISQEEFLGMTKDRFNKIDADKNGEISVDEMMERMQRQRLEKRAKRRLERMDINGDGKVTLDELENRAKKRFAMMDRNDDGAIEKSELRGFKHGPRGGKRFRRHQRDDG